MEAQARRLEASRVGLMEMDARGVCTYANLAAATAVGYSPTDLVGQDLHELVHRRPGGAEEHPRSACRLLAVVKTGEPGQSGAEESFWTKSGTAIPAGWVADPLLEEGKVVGVVINFMDLSAYRMVREETERQRGYMEILKKVGTAANAGSIDEAFGTMLEEVMHHFGYAVGHGYFRLGTQRKHFWQSAVKLEEEYRRLSEEVFEARSNHVNPTGIVGQALLRGKPAWTAEADLSGIPVRAEAMAQMGLRAAIACPILSKDQVVGLFEFASLQAGPPPLGLAETLFDVGVQMGRAIEREQGQEQLQAAATVAKARVAELERLHHEMTMINEIGNLLDGARSEEEVTGVLAEYGAKLFPDSSGELGLSQEEGEDEVRVMAHWGAGAEDKAFSAMDCWALRRGRIHETGPDSQLRCRHITAGAGRDLCIPMQAQKGTVGVLHLHSPDGDVPAAASRRQLAVSMAEHVSLALANFELRERLRYQAYRDPLTGLHNLRHLEETLAAAIERAGTEGRELALIEIDIDFFKSFNDDYGHDFGNEALRTLARFLEHNVREEDSLCRVGGEEFTLVMPDTGMAVAMERAEEIRSGVSGLKARRESDARGITISAGVGCFPEHGRTAGDLMRAVDEALYLSKRTGRNRVVRAVPLTPLEQGS